MSKYVIGIVALVMVFICSVYMSTSSVQPQLDGVRRDMLQLRDVTGHQWSAIDQITGADGPSVQDMANMTVMVEIWADNYEGVEVLAGWGSGVIIGPETILTARHLGSRLESPRYVIITYDNARWDVTETYPDPDSDLMVLIAGDMPSYPEAALDDRDPALGSDIVLIGTPKSIYMRNRVVKGNITTVHQELSLPEEHRQPTERWSRIVGISCHTLSGNSGGPVFYKGKVVGIFVGWVYGDHHFSVYIPVSELNIE